MLGVQVGVNLEMHIDDQPSSGAGRRLKSTAPAGSIHLHLMSCDVRDHLILSVMSGITYYNRCFVCSHMKQKSVQEWKCVVGCISCMPDALQSQTAGAHLGRTREGVQTGSISRMMTSQRCCQNSSCPLHAEVEVSARRSVHSGPQLRPPGHCSLPLCMSAMCARWGSLTCNPQTLRRCCQQCARSTNPCCRIPPAAQLRIPSQSRRCPAQTTLTPGDFLFIHVRECHLSSLQVFLIESTLYRGKSSLL